MKGVESDGHNCRCTCQSTHLWRLAHCSIHGAALSELEVTRLSHGHTDTRCKKGYEYGVRCTGYNSSKVVVKRYI